MLDTDNKYIKALVPVIFILLALYLVTLILQAWDLVGFILRIMSFISPFFIAYILAWLFKPIPEFFERHKVRRIFGTIVAFLIIFLVFYLAIIAFLPLLIEQIINFAEYVPELFKGFEVWGLKTLENIKNIDLPINIADYEESLSNYFQTLPDLVTKSVRSFLENVFGIVSSISSFLYNIVFVLTLAFYIMLDMDRVDQLFRRLIPKNRRTQSMVVLSEVGKSIRGYVNSFSIISLIVFILCFIGFSFISLPSAMLLALIIGVTNIIPYIGPILGGIPAIVVALSLGVDKAIIVFVIVLVVQQIDSLVLKPLLMGKRTNLHPLLILIGLLLFGKLWGIVGFIIATPIMSTIKIFAIHFNRRYRWFEE